MYIHYQHCETGVIETVELNLDDTVKELIQKVSLESGLAQDCFNTSFRGDAVAGTFDMKCLSTGDHVVLKRPKKVKIGRWEKKLRTVRLRRKHVPHQRRPSTEYFQNQKS